MNRDLLERVFESFRDMIVYVEDEIYESFEMRGDKNLCEDVKTANEVLDELYDYLKKEQGV